MAEIITSFRGPHAFLSNFYNVPVKYNGLCYRSAEAAFQAAKCPEQAALFTTMSSPEAKQAGKHVPLRPDWDSVKLQVMRDIVTAKFMQNAWLGDKLKATGQATLVEGNTWGDRFWGVCNGSGQNWLGRILMEVRDSLSQKN